MALSQRLLTGIRLAKRSRNIDPTCRFLSISWVRSGIVVPFKLSDIGEGIRDVTVKEWFVKPGDRVKQFDNICEVQSDKASVTITSRYDGLIKTLHFKINDVALIGAPLLDVEIEEVTKKEEVVEKTTGNDQIIDNVNRGEKTNEAKYESLQKVLTTPAVRRIAMENNINLKDVTATGKDKRILKEDVLAHLQKISTKSSQSVNQKISQSVESITGRTVELKGYSKHMWKTMTQSLSIPHFVYSDECIMDQVTRCRNEVKDSLMEQGVSLTLMPFFIKAASRALAQYPELNAWLNEEDQTLRILNNHNIGIAIDTSQGLVVPNIKNVQNLDIFAIAKELNRLQKLASKASIPLSDLTDTTFTLSNIGVVGGTYTKPVLLSPQVLIGAFGRTRKLPRFDEKENVVAANVMAISWSADHRVLDGVTVAKFSNLWKHYIENPLHLLIGA